MERMTQKTATAVAHVKRGKGLLKVNGVPLELLTPQILRYKIYEPIMLLKAENPWQHVDIRIRVKGGGQTSQIYGIRFSFLYSSPIRHA